MKTKILLISLVDLHGCIAYDTDNPDIKNQSATEYKYSVCGGTGWVLGQGTEYSKCLDKALAKWYFYHAED